MTKNFKLARKPGQGTDATVVAAATVPPPRKRASKSKSKTVSVMPVAPIGPTTRKTIEVPEEYFHKVKMRAVERKMLEKELWAEILREYFGLHPRI